MDVLGSLSFAVVLVCHLSAVIAIRDPLFDDLTIDGRKNRKGPLHKYTFYCNCSHT